MGRSTCIFFFPRNQKSTVCLELNDCMLYYALAFMLSSVENHRNVLSMIQSYLANLSLAAI